MKNISRLLLSISSCCLLVMLDSFLSSLPTLAADKVVFRYGLFERELSVTDIRDYAEKQQASPKLKSFLSYLSSQQQQRLQTALQVNLSLDIGALDQLLDTEMGKQALNVFSQAIVSPNDSPGANGDNIGIKAMRSAFILGTKSPQGLGIVSFLAAYPTERIVFDISKFPKLISMSNLGSEQTPIKDNLSASPVWQLGLKYQLLTTQGKKFSGCLFGDSISAELGNNLGANNFNFGFDGLSSVSLVEQLQSLIPNKVKCQKAVIAVGGNDAWYGMSDESFRQKLQSAISLIRKMGTKDIYLVPAFYSTVAASNDPTISAPIAKVTQINNIINQVGAEEKIPVLVEDLAGLYENNALKETLSSDGDHLNRAGLQIYQAALVKILGK